MKNKFKLFGGATIPLFTNKDLDVKEINFSGVCGIVYREKSVRFYSSDDVYKEIILWSAGSKAASHSLQGLTETFQKLLSKGEIHLYNPLHKQTIVLLEELARFENSINNLNEKRFNESLSNQGLAFKLKQIERFGDGDY